MKLQTALAGAALVALIAAGGAIAAPKHSSAGAYAPPDQPIAYSKLGAYLKASPAKRAKGDWATPAADTGAGVNTSATLPPSTPSDATPAAPAADAPPTAGAAMPATPDTPATPAPPATAPSGDTAPMTPAQPATPATPATPQS